MKQLHTTRGLILGFGLVLLMMAALGAISLSRMADLKQRIESIVTVDSVKAELIGRMRDLARQRIIILQSLVFATDPFEQDDLLVRMNTTAGEFIEARDTFDAMPLSADERQSLNALLQEVRVNQALHDQVVEAMRGGRIEDARRILRDKAMPTQQNVLQQYATLSRILRGNADKTVQAARKTYQFTIRSTALLGFLSLLGGVAIAVFVIRRTTNFELELFRQKERAEVTLDSIADAVITTDRERRVEYMNPVAQHLTGWTLVGARGRPLPEIFQIVNEMTRKPLAHPAFGLALDGRVVGLDSYTLLLARDGEEYAVEDSVAPIRSGDGKPAGVVLVFRDVTQARSLSRQLSWQALHDPLTGLPNRREFENRLKELLASAKDEGRRHTLLYVDLDQFKVVNDTCGHMAGDELLRQLTVLLQECIPPTAILARLGGDEFGVLVEDFDLERANEVAENLLEGVQGFRFVWEDKIFAIGASIGMVAMDRTSRSIASLLSAADAACYTAKNKGRNRVQIFQHDDVELAQMHGEMEWVARITKAFEEDRFQLYFQRIVPLFTESPPGEHLEVLLRMIGEEGELIPPGAYIPSAERYGLMASIDRWVIRRTFRVCSDLKACSGNAEHPATLSINLSGPSLVDDYFLEFVRDQFDIYGIPPAVICFEITETAAISNLQMASRFIREMKRLGCRFALDDFGSGMSSFAYLKNLDVDYLKIDGVFIRDMVGDSVDFAMVEAINRVGHVMGLKTIAEFVENDTIIAKLRELGVDFAQGYGIHRPEPFPPAPHGA